MSQVTVPVTGITILNRTHGLPARQRQKIDIEDLLVWTYKRQLADLMTKGGRYTWPACAGTLTQYMEFGVGVVRYAAATEAINDLHPDAEQVHRTVEGLKDEALGVPLGDLMIYNARKGARPDWFEGFALRLVPEISERTLDPKIVYLDRRRHYGYCVIKPDVDPLYIEFARELYSAWHRGLCQLVRLLARVPLLRYEAVGPATPASPWESSR